MDRLRNAPGTGHLTGETRKGDAINALFDQMPEDTVMCLTLVATPQDVLESHLNHLARKAVGETLASEQTRRDVQEARGLIGSAHKLYRGALAFYLRGRDLEQLDERGVQLANVMLGAGLQPVREDDEVAPSTPICAGCPACSIRRRTRASGTRSSCSCSMRPTSRPSGDAAGARAILASRCSTAEAMRSPSIRSTGWTGR